MNITRKLLTGLAGLTAALGLGLFASAPASAQTADILHSGFTPIGAFEQVHRMGRGVNVLGYDPIWRDPARARFQARHFRLIREAGFDTIRMNLNAFPFMDAQGRLDPRWVKTLDWAVRNALENGLTVIVDEHNFNECAKDVESCRTKLMAFWTQIGERYKDSPNRVIFELLNEPNGELTEARWNTLSAELLALVRQTNPERSVIIGPEHWNGFEALPALTLPDNDRNIIVTFHYYHPMRFTHQGASWVPEFTHVSGVTWGTPAEYAQIDRDFDQVQAWAKAHNRPIFLGEFGSLENGDMASRVRYDAAIARAAEKRGWAWAYWQFDSNFIVYDMRRQAWVEPILHALIPQANAGR